MLTLYTRSTNNKKIIILRGHRDSFRCRQRNKFSDGTRVNPLKFVSFKEMEKDVKRGHSLSHGPYTFYSVSKL